MDAKASHRKLLAKGVPLSNSEFVGSIKPAFCPLQSPVQAGRIPDGTDFISGPPTVMQTVEYDPITGLFKMACGFSRSLPHRKKRKSVVDEMAS